MGNTSLKSFCVQHIEKVIIGNILLIGLSFFLNKTHFSIILGILGIIACISFMTNGWVPSYRLPSHLREEDGHQLHKKAQGKKKEVAVDVYVNARSLELPSGSKLVLGEQHATITNSYSDESIRFRTSMDQLNGRELTIKEPSTENQRVVGKFKQQRQRISMQGENGIIDARGAWTYQYLPGSPQSRRLDVVLSQA